MQYTVLVLLKFMVKVSIIGTKGIQRIFGQNTTVILTVSFWTRMLCKSRIWDKFLLFVLFIIFCIVHYTCISPTVFQKFWSLRPVRWCGSTSGRRRMTRSTVRSPAPRCCSGVRRTTSRTECTSGKPPTRTDHSTAPRGLTLICTRRSFPSLTIVTFVHISLS